MRCPSSNNRLIEVQLHHQPNHICADENNLFIVSKDLNNLIPTTNNEPAILKYWYIVNKLKKQIVLQNRKSDIKDI